MKRLTPILLALAVVTAVPQALPAAAASAGGSTAAVTTASTGSRDHRQDFEEFLGRYEAANSAFLNGDPAQWLAITSSRDPQSIFGGFGGLGESGAAEVHQRYLLAATAFQPSGARVEIEYLVKDVQGRIAYTVAIERSDVRYSGHTDVHHQVLRVTMLFRREQGEWRIVHRHADTMVDLELPTA